MYSFSNHEFQFQDFVCNGCHDLAMLSVNISDTAVITFKNVDHRCIIHNINKSEIIYLKILFLKIVGIYKKDCLKFRSVFFSIYKMVDGICMYKSLNISIGAVMKNPEMLEFVMQLKITLSIKICS